MLEEYVSNIALFVFDLMAPLLEAEHRWNRNSCDLLDDLDTTLLQIEGMVNDNNNC